MRGDPHKILGLAAALVMLALGLAHAAEVGTQRGVAELDEGARERLRDLVVQRAAVERMRVRDERHAAQRPGGVVDYRLYPAGATRDKYALAGAAHMRRRATTRPPLRCSSMISSTSARST